MKYTGERQRHTFVIHVWKSRKAHQELGQAKCIPLTETTKVRRLLDSIQVTALAVPIATIKAQQDLRTHFDNCVNYLKLYVASINAPDTRNVSAYGQGSDKRTGPRKKKGPIKKTKTNKQNKDVNRFYTADEWRQLSDEQNAEIIASRKRNNFGHEEILV